MTTPPDTARTAHDAEGPEVARVARSFNKKSIPAGGDEPWAIITVEGGHAALVSVVGGARALIFDYDEIAELFATRADVEAYAAGIGVAADAATIAGALLAGAHCYAPVLDQIHTRLTSIITAALERPADAAATSETGAG